LPLLLAPVLLCPRILLLLLLLATTFTLLPLCTRCFTLTPLLRKFILLESPLTKLGAFGRPVVNQVELVLLFILEELEHTAGRVGPVSSLISLVSLLSPICCPAKLVSFAKWSKRHVLQVLWDCAWTPAVWVVLNIRHAVCQRHSDNLPVFSQFILQRDVT
jgi:hypothetical protein